MVTLTTNYNNDGGQTAHLTGSVRYLTFVGWFNFLAAIVLTVLFLTGKGGILTSVAGHAILVFWMFLFQLAGAGTITDALGGAVDCSSTDGLRYCNSLEALMAFSWISTIALFFALIVIGIVGAGAIRGGRGTKETLGA
ncbi:hypothetical protein CBOM_03249 [Ceraceosorus bombacis]|uniref:MARVEL domain-containing protein n=1 Tax=Ceraceosorus bombacis TaxID=401625 RepID=A0A0N7LAP8_9BASI|nr:hypothetical protein CBOM_03249 [Ceraceosorus bombacis]